MRFFWRKAVDTAVTGAMAVAVTAVLWIASCQGQREWAESVLRSASEPIKGRASGPTLEQFLLDRGDRPAEVMHPEEVGRSPLPQTKGAE